MHVPTRSPPPRMSALDDELARRIASISAADAAEQAVLATDGPLSLPVVCYDAMLPLQRLDLTTEDPTWCRFLRSVGIGGLFAMVSLQPRQRRIRRTGVLCRLTMIDVAEEEAADGTMPPPEGRDPTQVNAQIDARRRLRVLGPSEGMELRIGRFRRGYASDALDGPYSEPGLGWGVEKFVDGVGENIVLPPQSDGAYQEWSSADVQLQLDGGDEELLFAPPAERLAAAEASASDELVLFQDVSPEAIELHGLIDYWLSLARDATTYDNVAVTAGARARHGEPGLRLDPSRLIDRVLDQLGPRPPTTAPTALALWTAALVNPLPSLGVAPEMRGAVLDAADGQARVALVARGVRRSIANLEGVQPLR